MLQPLFSSQGIVRQKVSCCQKSHCKKEKPESGKNQCGMNGCNPFMACAYGNFFISGKGYTTTFFLPLTSHTKPFIPDRYISFYLSDCWHPPEIL